MRYKIAILALLTLSSGAALASGAPWYKWINTADRTIMCSQISPGDTWLKYKGPFMESQCKKPGNPQ